MSISCPKCNAINPPDSRFCKDCATPLPSSKGIPSSITKTIETSAQELTGGTTFAGRYQIIEELGRGGMGVVYKARDTKLKRTVALKFLPPELTHISEIKERFMHEAQAAAALDHPNICTVHEFDEAEAKTFISMAYVEGQSLKKKIEAGPLESDEALRIGIQAAEGLQEAHKKGVVHRDIKSANIMVTETGQAKIMDFGLARVPGGTLVTKAGTSMGTIAYMSPEQAKGEEIDHRTDIWSLGVVLYEMFSGQLPFKGEHDQSVVYSILNEGPKPITRLRPEIPMFTEQVVGKALEKDPDKRYQDMGELLEDLKSILEGIEPEGIRARLRKAKLLRRRRAILYAGAGGFLVIMAVIALSLFTGRVEALDSIAVLPLENLSGDPEQDYFSDGITDALINELSKIRALRVISRRSIMHYKGSDKPLSDIARELNVDALVESSLFIEGSRVQIRTQLIQASTEQNLWAQRYEREMSDIMFLQSDLARTIAGEIKVKVAPEETERLASARRVNPDAFNAYLKGKFHMKQGTPEGFEKGLAYLHQALEEDPADPSIYVELAFAYITLAHSPSATPDALPRARAMADRALQLDPTLAAGQSAIAIIKMYDEWDWEGAEQSFRRALELNANDAMTHYHYAWYLVLMGRLEEAIKEHKRAQELDPLTPLHTGWLGGLYWYGGRNEEAIAEARKSLELDPDYDVGLYILGVAHAEMGMFDEAIAAHQELAATYPKWKYALGCTYAQAGRRDEARKILAELEAREASPWLAWNLVSLYTALGEKDEAFRWMAYEKPHAWFPWIRVEPRFATLRDDPRFQDFLRRVNLPEYAPLK